jgi:hypothetical protein
LSKQRCTCQSGNHGHLSGDCPAAADIGTLCRYCHERAAIEAASATPIYAVAHQQLGPLTSSASAVIALVQSLPIAKDLKEILSAAAQSLEDATANELNVYKAFMAAAPSTVPSGFDQSLPASSFSALVEIEQDRRKTNRSQNEKLRDQILTLLGILVAAGVAFAVGHAKK